MTAVDPYSAFASYPGSCGSVGKAITPGGTDLSPIPKAVVCGQAGNITFIPVGNDDTGTITMTGVSPGYVPPYRIRRVTASTAAPYTIEG
jgi:hypothetical protein